jgi:hypothetical protein
MGASDLLSLSLTVQVALGGGYVAYLIAYAGIRQHHSATDVIFRTLAFGLIASAVVVWTTFIESVRLPLAVAAAAVAAALWRWKGSRWSAAGLRHLDVSWTDDIPTAWLSITALRTDCKVSQIAVDLVDGRTLLCDDTRRFQDAPFKTGQFGLTGDVAMYVTAERREDGTWLERNEVRNHDGDLLTYIPAASIKRVEIRHWTKRINGTAAAAGATAAGEAAEPAET